MIALVLANLPTNLSAAVLGKLPEAIQPDIALRIARMGETTAAVIEQLEHALRQRLNASSDREYAVAGGTKTLAGILNHADRALERNVLDNLASSDSELAEKVRGMLFVFEDLVKLEERAVQQVLREVDQKDLVLALRGAPEEVKEVVLTNMSERGAAMLKEEMEIQPPQRKSDIDAAQSRIVGGRAAARGSGHDRDRLRGGRRGGRGGCLTRPSSFPLEPLEPSEPPPRDAAERLLAQANARRRRSASRRGPRVSSRAAPRDWRQAASRDRGLGACARRGGAGRDRGARADRRGGRTRRGRARPGAGREDPAGDAARPARASSPTRCRARCGG